MRRIDEKHAMIHNPATINRTPNPDCPACTLKLQHTPEEWKQYHPNAGTGSRNDVNEEKKPAR